MHRRIVVLSLALTGSLGAFAGYAGPLHTDLQGNSPKLLGIRRPDLKRDYDLLNAAFVGETANVRTLLAKGARIESQDGQYGFTPLMWASWQSKLGTVRYLLSRGAKVNAHSKEGVGLTLITGTNGSTGSGFVSTGGVTPLMLACSGGSAMTARELIVKGADVNATSHDGDTALMCAAFKGYLPTVELLLARGARVNAHGDSGSTALVSAVLEGHTPVVKTLLHHGADVHAQWRDMPVLGLAEYYKYDDIARLLKRAGAGRSRPAVQRTRQQTEQ